MSTLDSLIAAKLTQAHVSGANGFGYETLGSLSLRAYGFSDEPILLRTQINKDLVVEITGWSTHCGERSAAKWEYEGLNFRYELPSEL